MINETNFQEHIVQTCQDMAELLLKLALNTNQSGNQSLFKYEMGIYSRTYSSDTVLEQCSCTLKEQLILPIQ